jgi:hypothetical protein
MSDRIQINRAVIGSADEFESVIKPISGTTRITPKYTKQFNASVSVSRLRRVGMALLDIEPMHARIEPQHNFYCLTVPFINSCHIKDANTRRVFSRNTAHLLYPDRALDSRHKGHCQLLGVTFMVDNLDDIARRLFGNASALEPLDDCSLSLTTPAGVNLVNLLSHVCGQVYREEPAPMTDLTAVELEDDLISALLLAMDENQHDTDVASSGNVSKCQIALAEDYLLDYL